jgi:hypothetical protein
MGNEETGTRKKWDNESRVAVEITSIPMYDSVGGMVATGPRHVGRTRASDESVIVRVNNNTKNNDYVEWLVWGSMQGIKGGE